MKGSVISVVTCVLMIQTVMEMTGVASMDAKMTVYLQVKNILE